MESHWWLSKDQRTSERYLLRPDLAKWPSPQRETRRVHLSSVPSTPTTNSKLKHLVKFIMFTCEAHYLLHENLEDLEQALNSQANASFCIAHNNCGNINLLPVHAKHHINIKCTECKFHESIVTHKPTNKINVEILNIRDSRGKAIHRQPARHHSCTTTCKTCQLIWQSDYVCNPILNTGSLNTGS